MALDSKASVAAKKKKLSSLAMPGSRGDSGLEIDLLGGDEHDAPTDDKDLDLSPDEMKKREDEEGPDEEGDESPAYQDKEDELGIEQHGDSSLAKLSDDELLAEIKKRGLDKELEKGEGESEDDDHILRA